MEWCILSQPELEMLRFQHMCHPFAIAMTCLSILLVQFLGLTSFENRNDGMFLTKQLRRLDAELVLTSEVSEEPKRYRTDPVNASVEGEPRLVRFEGRTWSSTSDDQLIKTRYRGHDALMFRPDGVNAAVFLEDLDFRFGTIELDLASASRQTPTVGIYGASTGVNMDGITIRLLPRFGNKKISGRLEQAVVTVRENTYVVLRVFADDHDENTDLRNWFHVRLELSEEHCKVFVNDDTRPAFVTENIFNTERGGKIGLCGDTCYVKGVRVTGN